MIRKLIQDQLDRCQFANLNNYDPKTNTFYIKKYSKPTYETGKCYLIKLPLEIVNKTDSVLAVNWNNGNAPKTQYLKIYISKSLGKMIYVDSISFDFDNKVDLSFMWSGWLDSEELTQITVL
jgi:hypothetical protein